MRNWKTNLGAAIVIFGAALPSIDPNWTRWGQLITALGAAVGLLFARDYDKSKAPPKNGPEE